VGGGKGGGLRHAAVARAADGKTGQKVCRHSPYPSRRFGSIGRGGRDVLILSSDTTDMSMWWVYNAIEARRTSSRRAGG